MPNTKRNIGVRSGMPTRSGRIFAISAEPFPQSTPEPSLREMFSDLQRIIVGQMQEQRREDEAQRREKDAEDRRIQAAFETQLTSIEERFQVVSVPIENSHCSASGDTNPRAGETVPVTESVNCVNSIHPAVTPVVGTPAASPLLDRPRVFNLGYGVKPTIFDGKAS